MRKAIIAIIILLALTGTTVRVLASDISNALFTGTIRATNNSTAAANISANVSINTPDWITNGTINATANNVAVRNSANNDTAFMPGYGSNPWVVWFNSVSANASIDYTLYTNASDGTIRYFPADGGMTVADHASLELGENFTFSFTGYIDTDNGTDKTILSKNDAVTVFVSPTVSGNITANITGTTLGSASGWTNSSNAIDGDNGTFASTSVAANTTTPYLYFGPGGSALWRMSEIRFWVDGSPSFFVDWMRLEVYDGVGWTTIYSDVPATGQWVTASFAEQDVSQIAARLDDGHSSGGPYTLELYELDSNAYQSVTATGLASGEYSCIVSANTTHLRISIDGVEVDTTASQVAVPDNTNGWTFFRNGVMQYVATANISVNGTQTGIWEWEYGDNFTDQSNNGNTATPTYRTTSSNANVTASLITFAPITLAQSTGNTSQTWPSMMPTPPSEPSTMFSENTSPGFWFGPFLEGVWSLSNLPNSFLWYNFAFMWIFGVSIGVYYLFAEKQTEALFIKVFATTAVMIFFALPGLNLYGLYVPVYYAFFATGIIMLKKDFGW